MRRRMPAAGAARITSGGAATATPRLCRRKSRPSAASRDARRRRTPASSAGVTTTDGSATETPWRALRRSGSWSTPRGQSSHAQRAACHSSCGRRVTSTAGGGAARPAHTAEQTTARPSCGSPAGMGGLVGCAGPRSTPTFTGRTCELDRWITCLRSSTAATMPMRTCSFPTLPATLPRRERGARPQASGPRDDAGSGTTDGSREAVDQESVSASSRGSPAMSR